MLAADSSHGTPTPSQAPEKKNGPNLQTTLAGGLVADAAQTALQFAPNFTASQQFRAFRVTVAASKGWTDLAIVGGG